MLFWWFIIWLLSDTPDVYMWNNWAIALAVCALISLYGLFERD